MAASPSFCPQMHTLTHVCSHHGLFCAASFGSWSRTRIGFFLLLSQAHGGTSSLFYELTDTQLFTFFTKHQLAWGAFGFVGAAAWSLAPAWTGLAMTLQLRAASPFQEDSAMWPPAGPASGLGLSHMPGFIPL